MKKDKIRAITDTAVASALSTLFIVIAVYVPYLSVVFSFVIGTPIIYVCFKRDWRYGCACILCTAGVSLALIGNFVSVGLIMLTYAFPSLILGICLSRNMKFIPAVGCSAAAILTALVIEMVMINGSGDGIRKMFTENAAAFSNVLKTALSQSGMLANTEVSIDAVVNKTIKQTVNMVISFVPSIVIISSVVIAYLTAVINVFILRRLRIKDICRTSFCMIYASKSMCLITGIILIVRATIPNGSMYSAAFNNLALLSVSGIAVCGLSALDFAFRRSVPSGKLRAIIYLAAFISCFFAIPMLSVGLVIIGFIDGLSGRRAFIDADGGGENENKGQ